MDARLAAAGPSARLVLLLAALLPALACTRAEAEQTAPPRGDRAIVRTARLSLRVQGDGRDVRLELPLVQSDEHQQLLSEKLLTRGFAVEEVVRDGNRLAILTYPKLEGRKRITYEFTVALRPHKVPVAPAPVATGDPDEEDELWLRPTLHLQSSSPLIREKLIRYATPRLKAGETDAIRIAWDLVKTYEHRPKGSKTVLKATRTGHASGRGLDRLFATFLRTSGVPARPVQGVDLSLKGRRRFRTWVEVKTGGAWAPMSVPDDLWGELPDRHVKLSHGDRPLVAREGVAKLSFRWSVSRPKPPREASR